MKSSTTGKLVLLAFIAVSLMGMVPVLVKLTAANEVVIGIMRLFIAGSGIFLLMLLNKSAGSLKRLSRGDLLWLVLLGLVFALHWYSYFYAIKTASPSLAAIGVSTFGIQLLFLNALIFKEKINKLDFLAIVIAFSGVLLATRGISGHSDMGSGFIASIFSGLLYALLAVINRKSYRLSTQQKALGQFGFALLCFSFFIPQGNFQLEMDDWSILLVLGLVCTLAAHTLWIKASAELPGNLTAIIYYFYLPVAIGLSAVFTQDALSWQKLTGAGLIIFANIMVLLAHKK
ncbi:DMT family transporter [Thalassomonas actiniarum]|uniref:DMT family transporter n=1 Tax=Thalassomonas actiniarum TaxID=485447 RepID=A0AAE9YT34_9GAMM|nr:DMT family transporter [Thalassomonas actiniarum]WDE00686.1 DMT family transporter [Thalassomonas actiniarum]